MSYEITDRGPAPYRSICYIRCEWSDGTFTRGSGVVVGINDVLTAHHVVYDATKGGYAVNVTVIPGADTSPYTAAYGTYTDVGVINARSSNWDTNADQLLTASESQYDLAVLGMRSAIGNITGWLATASYSSDFYGKMVGYPAIGTGMMEEAVFADASGTYGVYDIASGLGAGASGGPLLRTDASGTYVVGVLSSGRANLSASSYAGLFGEGTWSWLTAAMASNDSVMTDTPQADDYASSVATGGALAVGAAVAGTLETTTDSDWFRVSLSAGSYRFEARGSDTGDGTLSDPVLTLYSSTGVQLALDDDGGSGLNALFVHSIASAGTYYLGVSSPEAPYSASGSYRLSATSLTGGPVNLTGSGAADAMAGTSYDDSFRGAGGNDVIDGAGGVDTASYAGAREGYRLAHAGAGVSVADNVAGRDGTDSVTNIERLVFSDMSINLAIGAASVTVAPAQLKLLEELYVAFFNRVPDADGLAYWIGQTAAGLPLGVIADAFYSAALLYPEQTGYTSEMTSGDFVTLVYGNVLERSPDVEGLNYWRAQLDSGAQSRGSLVSSILASAHTFKGKADYGWVADLLDNKAAVAQTFAVEMGVTYNSGQESISKGMAIAQAVTADDTAAAIALIGISDGFTTLA